MLGDAGGRFKRTLAGVVVERRRRALSGSTARPVATGLPAAAPSRRASPAIWDHRFRIEVAGATPRTA